MSVPELTWRMATNLEMLDYVCRTVGAGWRVNPDGTIDAGPPTSLWSPVPAIMFSDSTHVADGGGPDDVRVIGSNVLSPSVDSGQRASQTFVAAKGEGDTMMVQDADTFGGVLVAFDAAGVQAVLPRLVDAPSATAIEASALAKSVQALWRDPRTSYRVSVKGDRWRPFVVPGALALSWFPQAGIIDLAAPVREVDGQTVFAGAVRVEQVEWSPSDGDGVYLVRHNAGGVSVTDLSEWTVTGDGGFVTVGDGSALLAESGSGSARFGQTAAVSERANR